MNARFYYTNNFNSIGKSKKCVCLYCKTVFKKEAIKDWVKTKIEHTALCPYCGVDAVMGDETGINIKDRNFIDSLHEEYFGD